MCKKAMRCSLDCAMAEVASCQNIIAESWFRPRVACLELRQIILQALILLLPVTILSALHIIWHHKLV